MAAGTEWLCSKVAGNAMTWGEFETATPEQRRARAQEWIAMWEEGYRRELQADTEADQRAYEAGLIGEPGPVDKNINTRSGTTRAVNK